MKDKKLQEIGEWLNHRGYDNISSGIIELLNDYDNYRNEEIRDLIQESRKMFDSAKEKFKVISEDCEKL
tara:strand:+ start:1952 stop:2158 length:207 start_codon:yes stop_codon:yes gene_type:complete